eukprot:1808197-Ditylum_brightwellii.AAC.1
MKKYIGYGIVGTLKMYSHFRWFAVSRDEDDDFVSLSVFCCELRVAIFLWRPVAASCLLAWACGKV